MVTEPAGAGPAAARNRGAARAGGDVIVFVDADVEVHPDALARLRAAFADDPALAAVFGSYDDAPGRARPVSRFRNLLHHHVHSSPPGPAETFWAGLGAIRREAFLAAGGFDAERFPARRRSRTSSSACGCAAPAARIVLDPAVRGTHLKRWTLRRWSAPTCWRRGVPWVRLQLEAGALDGLAQPRLAPPARRARGARGGRGRARPAPARRAGGARARARAQRALLRAAAAPRRPALVWPGVPLHLVHHLTALCGAGAVRRTRCSAAAGSGR